MPPSAMIGTLCGAAARAHSAIAVIIGTPMPATTRVVQIEPAPMPTLTASTPQLDQRLGRLAVATLPATRSTSVILPPDAPHHVEHALRMAVRGVDRRARRRARRRAPRRAPSASLPTPIAAPTRSRPSASLHAFGYLTIFWMSLTVISPFSM